MANWDRVGSANAECISGFRVNHLVGLQVITTTSGTQLSAVCRYGAFDEGIRTHADAAYVNVRDAAAESWLLSCGCWVSADIQVNFWITPSEANLDSQSGGLVVYKRGAPDSWDFAMYNNGEGEAARTAFVEGAENVTVPHRQNRAGEPISSLTIENNSSCGLQSSSIPTFSIGPTKQGSKLATKTGESTSRSFTASAKPPSCSNRGIIIHKIKMIQT